MTKMRARRTEGRRLLLVRRGADLRAEPRPLRRDRRARRVGGAPRRPAQRRAVRHAAVPGLRRQGLREVPERRQGHEDRLQRQRLLQQLQRRQARHHHQPLDRDGARDRAQAHRLVRRLHHEPDEPHGRPLALRLRRAEEDQREHHRRLPADAGLRRPAQGLLRLRRRAQRDHRLQRAVAASRTARRWASAPTTRTTS